MNIKTLLITFTLLISLSAVCQDQEKERPVCISLQTGTGGTDKSMRRLSFDNNSPVVLKGHCNSFNVDIIYPLWLDGGLMGSLSTIKYLGDVVKTEWEMIYDYHPDLPFEKRTGHNRKFVYLNYNNINLGAFFDLNSDDNFNFQWFLNVGISQITYKNSVVDLSVQEGEVEYEYKREIYLSSINKFKITPVSGIRVKTFSSKKISLVGSARYYYFGKDVVITNLTDVIDPNGLNSEVYYSTTNVVFNTSTLQFTFGVEYNISK